MEDSESFEELNALANQTVRAVNSLLMKHGRADFSSLMLASAYISAMLRFNCIAIGKAASVAKSNPEDAICEEFNSLSTMLGRDIKTSPLQ